MKFISETYYASVMGFIETENKSVATKFRYFGKTATYKFAITKK